MKKSILFGFYLQGWGKNGQNWQKITPKLLDKVLLRNYDIKNLNNSILKESFYVNSMPILHQFYIKCLYVICIF